MQQEHFSFSTKNYTGYFNVDFSYLEKLVSKEKSVIITDKNIAVHYSHKFISWRTIVIEAGERTPPAFSLPATPACKDLPLLRGTPAALAEF